LTSSLTFSAGSSNLIGRVSNSVPLTVSGGSLVLGGSLDLPALTIGSAGTVILSVSPQVGSVLNAGTLTLGTRTLSVSGDYTQTSTGTLKVSVQNISTYGRIVASGQASLAGTVTFTWISGYAPAAGHQLNFLQATQVSGTWSSVLLDPVSPGLMHALDFAPGSVSLRFF
jgi:hypothetical protein